jgi:hypothetical protein
MEYEGSSLLNFNEKAVKYDKKEILSRLQK